MYIQALISQCLDANFLDEVFSDQGKNDFIFNLGLILDQDMFLKICINSFFSFQILDDYFVSNIEKVDSVTLLRKDKVMNGVGWALRFTQSVNTWPCLNDLGAAGVSVHIFMLYFILLFETFF